MKLDRLISILIMLLRRERVQAKELAERFDVSVRTILRDVDSINLAGIPIVTYQGANGGIGIAEGYRLDKSVLNETDMAAIITALKGVDKTIHDRRHEVLMDKLKNTLSATQLDLLNTKVNQLVIDLSPWGESQYIKENVVKIRKAIEALKEIEFNYTDPKGNKTSRRAEPYSLLLKGQKWYLYAWCLTRHDFRLFKLSRMKDLTASDTIYKPREMSMEQLQWESDFRNIGEMICLELIFIEEMESVIEEWFGAEVIKHEDGRIMVNVSLPENNWLYGFLLSFGTGLEVVNPPHIRKILADIAEKINKKYSK